MRNATTNKETVGEINRTEWSEVRTSELEDKKQTSPNLSYRDFKKNKSQK